MEAFAVVKGLKLLKHRLFGVGTGLIGLMMYQLGFQGVEEAF
jgi:hypothetical protein